MPLVAEAVLVSSTSLHSHYLRVLGDSLIVNTAVGLSTVVQIGSGGLLCIFPVFAPIIYLQFPYQNSFSGIL